MTRPTALRPLLAPRSIAIVGASRILVQRMASGVEILVGGVWDERFGPAVTCPGGEL